MPNHIKNSIELIGSMEDIDSLLKAFGTQMPATINKTHDGNLVICKHKSEQYNFCWMDLSTGHVHNRGEINQTGLPDGFEIEIKDSFFHFPDFEKVIPPPDDPAYKDLPTQEIARHSPNWWYNWNVENWGSKWGSYSCEKKAINKFTFETAWSPSPIIIEAISKAFPTVTIKYVWADEDTGHNCGRATYHNGLIEEFVPEGGSNEAYEIAFELWSNGNEYELVDGRYKYHETEES